MVTGKTILTIPQKMIPQGEQNQLTYKVCFPLKINEEGLHFDDKLNKVEDTMTSIFFGYQKRPYFYQNCSKNMFLIAILKKY